MDKFVRSNRFSSLTESGKRICYELYKNPSLPASTLAILTGLSRQTVYKETDKLIRIELVKLVTDDTKKMFLLSENLLEEEKRIIERFKQNPSFFDMSGQVLSGIFHGKANNMIHGPFVENTSLFPLEKSKPKLKQYLFRKTLNEFNGLQSINEAFLKIKKAFTDLYPDNHRITWVISPYHQKYFMYGAGIDTFLKGLEEVKQEKASISLSCDVPEYHGNHLYILDARYESFYYEGNEFSRLDQVTLAILTNYIPINQIFLINWDQIDPLPFVREAEVNVSLPWNATFITEDILGYMPDSHPQIIAINLSNINMDGRKNDIRIKPRGGLCFFIERRKSLQEVLGNESIFKVRGYAQTIKYKHEHQLTDGLIVYNYLAVFDESQAQLIH